MAVDSDWSSLPPDLLVDIATRTLVEGSVEDFMALKGVCASWRAAIKLHKFAKPWPSVPFIMLPEKKENDFRDFFSLSKGKVSMTLPLPEAKGKRCLEARFGWLLTLASSGEVSLLNPLSLSPHRAQIQVPNFKSFPGFLYHYPLRSFDFIERAILSANPSNTPNDFVLFVIAGFGLHVGFWRPRDKSWTMIESYCNRSGSFMDINYHNQKLYALYAGGNIGAWDVAGADNPVLKVVLRVDSWLVANEKTYLVESSLGELLLITRNGCRLSVDDDYEYGATRFIVFRLDVGVEEFEEITNLGEDAIFVGHSATMSIAVTSNFQHVIKPNCIYFTDDSTEAYTMKCPHGPGDLGGDGDTKFLHPEELALLQGPIDPEEAAPQVALQQGLKMDESESEEEEDEKDESESELEEDEDEVGWPHIKGGRGGAKDMGVYNLEDGSIERFDEAETLSFTNPPLWIAPSSF